MVKVKKQDKRTFYQPNNLIIWPAVSMILLYIKSRTGYRILIDFFGLQLRQEDVLFILY